MKKTCFRCIIKGYFNICSGYNILTRRGGHRRNLERFFIFITCGEKKQVIRPPNKIRDFSYSVII